MTEARLAALLAPYVAPIAAPLPPSRTLTRTPLPELYPKLLLYLELLRRWNQRTNLTSIREPEEIVQRHFGESLFTALHLIGRVDDGGSLLDFGSGAGFPGLPVQLMFPRLKVTLGESQGKKAAFLREAVRSLELTTHVWGERVENMSPEDRFTVVTMRAVDDNEAAKRAAWERVGEGGWLVTLKTGGDALEEHVKVPGLQHGRLSFLKRS